ncbi:dihydrodipicolinate synthase family protein [Paenibacillus radicis (ex Xue et al. 2023)]|uniref:Dihydrodipicolinate synthase family protein n=1 Tax=Paenibacillus radicis (ex Xue et al. 2023) TaxID=2972489 RepID=A0ABT1YLS5_9BACL|nr:dihydrodipicolinate synthase family protein [Paenibacillus radicis (ex Xue et al. 2023)]MCR8634133.1 dihydrodipicolinate synthase family protein [Paenibacillus radicis (ex Xue et al. 2023)]
MGKTIVGGVWPTMLTPFTETGALDEHSLEQVVDWYIDQGVHGLFAVCNSSEMFKLSLEERVRVAEITVRRADGRVPVIASGHISEHMEDQIEEITRISATGIDAFVLLSNRPAAVNESEDIWKGNVERLLEAVPDVPFGLYECPVPYKRLMNPALLQWCESTGRFLFLKDTCCNLDEIGARLEALRGTGLQLFNANAAMLLESLKLGAAGFSGIMSNHHPALYVWLLENWRTQPEAAERVQNFLGIASGMEGLYYPVDAKYSMQLAGLPLTLTTRVKDAAGFQPHQRIIVEQLKKYSDELLKELL